MHNWDDILGFDPNKVPVFSAKFTKKLEDKTNEFKSLLDEKIYQLNSENPFIHFTEIGRNSNNIEEYLVNINAKDVGIEMYISGIIEMTIANIRFHFKHSKILYE